MVNFVRRYVKLDVVFVGGKKEIFKLCFPRLKATFTGTGDVFAALLLAWLHRSHSLKEALELTVATLQSILKRTISSIEGECDNLTYFFPVRAVLAPTQISIQRPKSLHLCTFN